MDPRRKLAAVVARLGQPRQEAKKKGEYGFMCPGIPGTTGCSSVVQGKVRLWVNPSRDEFNCWHCGFRGRNLGLLMVWGSAEQREYLAERVDAPAPSEPDRPRCTTLPDGFTPFGLSGSRSSAPYLSYLRHRGVSERTVALYRMGYVDGGFLSGRVVVPSFDSNGLVNFWSARSINPGEHLFRYRLPNASKDVISNEHMVDWTSPVYLVEGIFDEIAIGSQAISLYGKTMLPTLALRLVERRPPMIYVCLDDDARTDAFRIVKRLTGYDLPCALLDLAGKDPAIVKAAGVAIAVEESRTVTGSASLVRSRF